MKQCSSNVLKYLRHAYSKAEKNWVKVTITTVRRTSFNGIAIHCEHTRIPPARLLCSRYARICMYVQLYRVSPKSFSQCNVLTIKRYFRNSKWHLLIHYKLCRRHVQYVGAFIERLVFLFDNVKKIQHSSTRKVLLSPPRFKQQIPRT